MKLAFLAPLLFPTLVQAAEWVLSPRYDGFAGNEVLINRGMLLTDFSAEFKSFKFYFDGFGEADVAPEESRTWRRAKDAAYLQEMYVEFIGKTFFFKIGKQAARWSESWIMPSLDIWTARRYERLFVDPLALQLNHSTGAVFTIVQPNWSLDFAAMTAVPYDTYPEPFPESVEVTDKEPINPGLRMKFDIAGAQSSIVFGRSLRRDTLGYALNYAFDNWVPKLEMGMTYNDQIDDYIIQRKMSFGSLGADIFWGNWTLTPQVTGFQGEDPYADAEEVLPQAVVYMSVLYSRGNHEIQLQGFSNTVYNDRYLSGTYTYTLKQKWSFSGIVQNYQGLGMTLTSLVKEETGGALAGIRLQYTGSLLGR